MHRRTFIQGLLTTTAVVATGLPAKGAVVPSEALTGAVAGANDPRIIPELGHYILHGREVVRVDVGRNYENLMEWARWMQNERRSIRASEYANGTRVSTCFLGLDHSWSADDQPLVFETMIFDVKPDHELDGYQDRCSTYDEAIAMHDTACETLEAHLGSELGERVDTYQTEIEGKTVDVIQTKHPEPRVRKIGGTVTPGTSKTGE